MSDQPKHIEIADDLAERIRAGEWEPGEQLPGQRRYAERRHVSEQTVTRAFEILKRQGLIRTERYRGSFVAETPPHETTSHETASVNWWVREDDERFPGGRTRWETVDAGVADPAEVPPEVREALQLPEDEGAVWRIRRLLDAGEPAKWDRPWWRGRLLEDVPELAEAAPVTEGTDKLIERRTGRRVAGGRDRMRARGASARDSELLGVERGQPVLEVRRHAWDAAGEPLLFEVDVYRGHLWSEQEPFEV